MSTHYPRIANDPQNEVHLCGSWEMIVGDLDTFGTVLQVIFSACSNSLPARSSHLGIQRLSWPQTNHGAISQGSSKFLKEDIREPRQLMAFERFMHNSSRISDLY